MTSAYQAGPLKFNDWPFDIVPRPGKELIWADRVELKDQIIRLGRRLGRHEAVSLHLLWADFGAGKTHTLLYLKQEAERGRFGSVLPLYSVLPKGCRTFNDIYRAIVRAIPAHLLREAFHAACKSVGRESLETRLAAFSPSLPRCFHLIADGADVQKRLALAWLHSEMGLSTRELQGLTLYGRIRSTDDAVLALCGIARLLNAAGHKRVLFMVDEFQRVEALRQQQQEEINAGLHGFFNACGHGMSLLLTFSFGVEANIRHFLNRELLSRVDPIRISMPALTRDTGIIFLNEVIAQGRDSNEPWPVASGVVSAIVDTVSVTFEPTPRRLIKAAGLVFELASIDFEDGTLSELTESYVKEMADRGNFLRLDDQQEDA